MLFHHYTPSESLRKIKQYCAYQERCHSEVRSKLYSFGLAKEDVEEIISILITENYLNEERFAILFAGSKFRMKNWGENKIKQALKRKHVSEYCIKKSLKKIDHDDYENTLQKLAQQKLEILKNEKNIFVKKRKLRSFLLQKGFESEVIREVINNI